MQRSIYRNTSIRVVAAIGFIILFVLFLPPLSKNAITTSRTNINTKCSRSEMYDIQPEFERALSLIKQRLSALLKRIDMKEYDFSFFNCLDIQYADIKDAEGFFSFDPNVSSANRLKISVDNSYKNDDDLLTAFLLSHEIFHVSNYLNKINFGTKIGCVDDEISAFEAQILFVSSLNTQEQESINKRLQDGRNNINNPLKMVWDLFEIKANADKYCGIVGTTYITNNNCYNNKLTADIKTMVKNSPYYQKECGL